MRPVFGLLLRCASGAALPGRSAQAPPPHQGGKKPGGVRLWTSRKAAREVLPERSDLHLCHVRPDRPQRSLPDFYQKRSCKEEGNISQAFSALNMHVLSLASPFKGPVYNIYSQNFLQLISSCKCFHHIIVSFLDYRILQLNVDVLMY